MLRTLEINNVYERYEDEVTHVTVEILTPAEVAESDEWESYEDYLFDTIFPHTGVGHEDGNSAYFVESTDGLEPAINEEYGT